MESKVGKCIFCKEPTNSRCKRCGDFYCCLACQNLDWPKHRYICFPLPRLVSARDIADEPASLNNSPDEDRVPLLKDLILHLNKVTKLLERTVERTAILGKTVAPLANEIGEEEQEVLLCLFSTCNRVAIRSTKPDKEAAYQAVIEKVLMCGRNTPRLSTIPEVGQCALTKTNIHFKRVEIMAVDGLDRIRVLFTDYGNCAWRSLSGLHEIPEELLHLEKFVTVVQLHDVSVYSYNKRILNFLKSMEQQRVKIKYVFEGGVRYAKLYDVLNGELLNEKVNNFCAEHEASLEYK